MTYIDKVHPSVANLMADHARGLPSLTVWHDNLDAKLCACARYSQAAVVSAPAGAGFDGETCASCGGMTQRTGSCRTCTTCGANTGCG